jgi:hypothetical protein
MGRFSEIVHPSPTINNLIINNRKAAPYVLFVAYPLWGLFCVVLSENLERNKMADGSIVDRNYTFESNQFGTLKRASSEVWIQFEPSDNETYSTLKETILFLGLNPDRPTTELKMIRCLSDFVMAVKAASNGLICWPSSSDHFTGAAYGQDIAKKIKQTLTTNKLLSLDQKSSKRDGLAQVYRVFETPWMQGLKLKPHGIGPSVEVRSPKIRNGSQVTGAQKMSRKAFLPQIIQLEGQVDILRQGMMQQQLTTAEGQTMGVCKRIFNQGSLKSGGRLYGRWQSLPEAERLNLLIDGEAVCEIDVKAMFLNICNAKFGSGIPFTDDPYLMIPFVGTVNDPDRQANMRKLSKLLLSAYLSNGQKVDRFPKGSKKDPDSNNKKLSVREHFNLPKNAKAEDYFDDILNTFPFLKMVTDTSYGLMFIESEIMIKAMSELINIGIVTFPVHDCLMCKRTDENSVIEAIQSAMNDQLGTTIMMDISYSDLPTKIIPPLIGSTNSKPRNQIVNPTDDFDVLEDF